MTDLPTRDALLSHRAGLSWPYAALLDHLRLCPETSVLDIGAGTGQLGRELVRRGHVGIYQGLDVRLAPPRVAPGDAHALPWSETTFGAVILLRVLPHLSRPAKALAEARRVLRPGGRLVVAEHGPAHLYQFWKLLKPDGDYDTLAETPHPSSFNIRVPVRLDRDDIRTLAASYGRAVDTFDFAVLDDELHLRGWEERK